jgi:lysozyme
MKISQFGKSMIAAFEGVRLEAYRCPAGVLTIGIGITGEEARPGRKITREEAFSMFDEFLARQYEPGVRKLLKRDPTQGQWDAMVSFAFNCGVGALAKSSILKHFNRGNDDLAAAAFGAWVKAGGKTLPGLVRRRAAEALAFRGIQDANFDGKRASDEPIYGPMPQKVEQVRESVAKTSTAKGAGAGGLAGAGAVIKSTEEALTTAEPHISAGTWIGFALGLTMLASAGFVFYRRWRDGGGVWPWEKD